MIIRLNANKKRLNGGLTIDLDVEIKDLLEDSIP